MSEQIVIVGGGQAASCAAIAIRQARFRGRILILGDESLQPYERPPLSKDVLVGEKVAPTFLCREARYAEQDVEVQLNALAAEIDLDTQRLHLANGGTVAYDKLLLATGGRPRQLTIPGGEHVSYLRTYAQALKMRTALRGARRVLCIGGGVIGLEIAASARALGCEVIVVESGPFLMGRCLAQSEATFIQGLHEDAGVDVRLSTSIVGVERNASTRALNATLSDGGIVDADYVVAGIGMERNVELAAAAGIAVENGILVDESGRTSAPRVFAAGDVAAFLHPLFGRLRLESWHHAQGHGTLVGHVMAGGEGQYEDVPRFWTDQYSTNLQVAGTVAEATYTALRGDRTLRKFTAVHLGSDGRVVGVTVANNPREIRPALKMIRDRCRPDLSTLSNAEVPLEKVAA